uniref:Uncharacterized protein n=1 Tax=Oryza brachyantha TaxID=4533 RepID=J3L2I1_ORYBR
MEDAAARHDRLLALRVAKDLLYTTAGHHQNGNHDTTGQQLENPTLLAPLHTPEAKEASKENITLVRTLKKLTMMINDIPAMKFRNYLPHDEQLRGGKLAPVSLPNFEDPISAETAEPKQLEDPFGNIAPKNPNWDLKRDVQKRIDKLEKRTQKALAEIAGIVLTDV